MIWEMWFKLYLVYKEESMKQLERTSHHVPWEPKVLISVVEVMDFLIRPTYL